MDDQQPAYEYRTLAGPVFETCDAPQCERLVTIEVLDDPHLFCSTGCADRTL